MIGEAALLAIDVPLPKGIHLRRVTSEPDVHALSAMEEEVFKGGFAEEMADALLRRLGLSTATRPKTRARSSSEQDS